MRKSTSLPNAPWLQKGHCCLESFQSAQVCLSDKSNVQMKMKMEQLWNNINREKPKTWGEKSPSSTFIHHKCHMDWKWIEFQPPRGRWLTFWVIERPLNLTLISIICEKPGLISQKTHGVLVQNHIVHGNCASLYCELYEHIDTVCDVKSEILNVTEGGTYICQCILNIERHCLLHYTEDHICKHECLCNYITK